MVIKSIHDLHNIKELLDELPDFNYQEELTKKLDNKQDEFTYETF